MIDDNCVYVLGVMGYLYCFDVGIGDVLWKCDLNEEYEIEMWMEVINWMLIWGIVVLLLVYEDLVIVYLGVCKGCSVVVFDKKFGEEVWCLMND